MKDVFGTVNVYLLPFVKASQVRKYFPEEEITTYENAIRIVLENAKVDENERNILVAHQFVTGGKGLPELSGSEGVAAQTVGLVEQIGAACFDAFDYVALGHIHSAQRVGRETVRYSGSPMKYSLSEVHHEKSVTSSYVEFQFSHQGKEYRIYRKPSYERPKLRGNGTISEKEKAQLYIEGEAPIEGCAGKDVD